MTIIKCLILLCAIGFLFALFINRFFKNMFKDNVFTSHFIAFMGALFGFYIILCLISS